MKTTNLVVELVVIGVGSLTWIVLFLSCLPFDYWPLLAAVKPWMWVPLSVPILAFIYVLGIVTDRVSDWIFDLLWGNKILREYFKNVDGYYLARRQILQTSDHLTELLDYGRSRLRVCRSWFFHSLLIGIFVNVILWTKLDNLRDKGILSVLLSLGFIVLAVTLWYAWRNIAENEYRKVLAQSRRRRARS